MSKELWIDDDGVKVRVCCEDCYILGKKQAKKEVFNELGVWTHNILDLLDVIVKDLQTGNYTSGKAGEFPNVSIGHLQDFLKKFEELKKKLV